MKRDFLLLTLASNGKPTIIPKDNIAFAIEIDGENEQKQKETFTRVFLKQVTMDDLSKWVDVVESAEEILKK